MHTVTTKVPSEMNLRLEGLAKMTERNKSYLVRKAIEEFLIAEEDYMIALSRYNNKGLRVSLEDLERECELEG